MRLIDADAYAAEMKKRQDVCMKAMENASYEGEQFSPHEHWGGVLAAFAEAKLTLDDMPTASGWISVKDSMPEEDGQYLVLLNKTHLMVVSFAKKLEEVDREVFAGRDEPGWFEWDTEWCGFYEVTAVTHWMPVEPPEEVTGDD